MPHSNNLAYAFGPFQFNPTERVLTRDGETVSLRPKAAEILIMLVTNAGQLVDKDELLSEVWPETFVEEANLTQNIFTLRRALGDETAGPRYIETVKRRGYRFIAAVKVISVNGRNGDPLAAVGAAATRRPVIAVLPFLNDTGDSELEYLADGVTDNIINNLSRVSKLRVMSHSAAFRYKTKDVDPQHAGRELGAHAVLVGKIDSRPAGIAIAVELVDPSTGWQLWGEVFDSESTDILEIQDAITRQILSTLQLKLTGEEEKRVTARYTENAAAYQSYLEGRFHWSRYTRRGIEKAITHFRQAIELDPNYALAYAAIVDCYLRLATNYLPPEDDLPDLVRQMPRTRSERPDESDPRVKLRFEWDWKTAERELRRANELKTDYPSAHQWYVAYRTSKQLYRDTFSGTQSKNRFVTSKRLDSKLAPQIPSARLTPTEEVQILCSVARDQMAIGNFEAANLILRRWSGSGRWPKLDFLNPYAAADLLFTIGTLLGCVASTKQMIHGHKQAEAFLNGSVALFEQLGVKTRSVEARIELARGYYRQGLFDIARATLSDAFSELPDDEPELKNSCLTVLGAVEREAGRLRDALAKLREAASLEVAGDLVTAKCYHELAITLKDLTIADGIRSFVDEATLYFQKSLYEYEAVGNYRLAAAVENNFGFLLLSLGSLEESETHLLRARRLFDCLSDSVRGAQVNETLARLYIETKQYDLAREVIEKSVGTLEMTDGAAFLAEALTTNGVVAARQTRRSEAKKNFEAAHMVAERCGDNEGAGRALLIMFEELGEWLDHVEQIQIAEKLKTLLSKTQQTALVARVEACIAEITVYSKGENDAS
jgi:DNA-binding winged helix-turn-helix (wHTH) protein/tetratricopeptide (TPR) repeat protein